MIRPHIQVEGLAEFQRDLKAASGGKLPAALGEAHKEIGRFIIAKIPQGDPSAVGSGYTATVRPSATKRDVILRVGGAFRNTVASKRRIPTRYVQWGKFPVQPFARGARPYILGVVEENEQAIIDEYKKRVMHALAPAFNSAE
jgi:hypothetical protein